MPPFAILHLAPLFQHHTSYMPTRGAEAPCDHGEPLLHTDCTPAQPQTAAPSSQRTKARSGEVLSDETCSLFSCFPTLQANSLCDQRGESCWPSSPALRKAEDISAQHGLWVFTNAVVLLIYKTSNSAPLGFLCFK